MTGVTKHEAALSLEPMFLAVNVVCVRCGRVVTYPVLDDGRDVASRGDLRAFEITCECGGAMRFKRASMIN